MSDPLMTQITMFATNFPPNGWSWCMGQLMAVSQYQSLFSLLGTNFGGDGRTSFALPDLRGRMPIGTGTGQITSPRVIGEKGGYQTENLDINSMASHTHTSNGHGSSTGHLSGTPNTSSAVKCNNTSSSTGNPLGKVWGKPNVDDFMYENEPGENDTMHAGLVSVNVDMSSVFVSIDTDLHSIDLESTGGNYPHENMMPYLGVPYCISLDGLFPSRN